VTGAAQSRGAVRLAVSGLDMPAAAAVARRLGLLGEDEAR